MIFIKLHSLVKQSVFKEAFDTDGGITLRLSCYGKMVLVVLISVMLLVSQVSAEKKIFHGTGEYTMSDYETPAVAEQRALAYAKRRAAEQAGAYVETYTRMEKVQVTADRVKVLVSGAMQIINQKTEKKAMPGGDVRIVANITAEVDTSFIDKALSQENRNRHNEEAQLKEIQQIIAKEEQETQELKRKITELKKQNIPVKDLQLQAKAQEQIFLANQKIDEAFRSIEQGNYDKAILVADEAVKLNPKELKTYGYRGEAYSYKGEYDKAINDYNMALTIDPNNVESYNNRGIAYSNKGEIDRAINDYNMALSINPNNVESYNNRGVAYSNKGEIDRAINDYNMALSINPKDADVYNNRGAAYHDKGDIDRAINDYNMALTIDPNNVAKNADVYNNRGVAYSNKGEIDRAINDYNIALTINPKMRKAYNNRAIIFQHKKDYSKAIKDFTHAIQLDDSDAYVYYNRGNCYLHMNEYSNAIRDYNQAISLNPKYEYAYNNRGLAYEMLGDYDKAIADYRRALEINPNSEEARNNLQLAYDNKRKHG